MEKNKTEADIPFEQSSDSYGSAVPRDHQAPFMDHEEGNGILIEPRSILRMRVEKGEVSWSDIEFKVKSQIISSFAK